MSKMHIDNTSAIETFASAYEASQEPTPRAPRRIVRIEKTAEFFARERLLDAAEQDSGQAIIDDLDENARELHEISTRPASYLDPAPVHDDLFEDEYTLMAERHGADSDIAMSDLVEFGGTIDLATCKSEPTITRREINNLFRLFKKSALSESERELVDRYADDPDCDVPVNPIQVTFGKPKTLAQIKRRLRRKFYFYKMDPEVLNLDARDDYEASASIFKYAPIKPALEPVDREEETEAHRASNAFKRMRNNVDKKAGHYAKRFAPHNGGRKPHYLDDVEHRETIRHQSWSEQLPWCGEEYLEHTFYGYTDAELDEDSEEEADLRSELAQWEMNLELGEINQAFDYREEALQKLEDEAYALREHRKNFIRDYDHMVRCSNIALQRAMASYDLELTVIADQRDTFDLDPLLNLDDSQLAAE